jgi:hypothetical protein
MDSIKIKILYLEFIIFIEEISMDLKKVEIIII